MNMQLLALIKMKIEETVHLYHEYVDEWFAIKIELLVCIHHERKQALCEALGSGLLSVPLQCFLLGSK